MGRVVIVVAPGTGIEPAAVVSAWNADAEASATGTAAAETAKGQDYFPGLVELVVIPLVVNVASSAVYDLVKRLAVRLRPAGKEEPQVEQAEAPGVTAGTSDVIIVIRDMGGRH